MNLIFYFTGTGNSLDVARALAGELGDTRLIRICHHMHPDQFEGEFERVGVVTPVYFGGIPNMVEVFLENLTLSGTPYVFSAVTFAKDAQFAPLKIRQALEPGGHTVQAEFLYPMPDNNQTKYPPTPEEKQKALLSRVPVLAAAAGQILQKKQEHHLPMDPRASRRAKIGERFKHLRESDKSYHTTDRCDGCGTCFTVCPARNIAMEDGVPVWRHRCERCTACMQFCPQGAIVYADRSLRWVRYHDPNIDIADLVLRKPGS